MNDNASVGCAVAIVALVNISVFLGAVAAAAFVVKLVIS